MTNTKYDYELLKRLQADRAAKLKASQDIIDRAQGEKRDLSAAEHQAVEAAMNAIKSIDAQIKEQNAAMLKAVLGGPAYRENDANTVQFLSLRTPAFASDLTARFGKVLGTPGVKALLDQSEPYVTIPMAPEPVRMEQAPTALLETLPAVTTPVVYRYMRQTSRTNNAAPVAPGALKPTSVFGLEPVEGRLRVVAHTSEAIDKYVLADGPSLAQFVQMEAVDGLHAAVEGQLLGGDGVGENITGLASMSGIQTQALVTDGIRTARAAVTKVEVLGFSPQTFVLSPADWEAVETQQTSTDAYVLNAEGSRTGAPVDSATRRLWGVPVTISTGLNAGTGYLFSNGAAQVATDGRVESEWSSNIADDFQRNLVRCRVEGRFNLSVAPGFRSWWACEGAESAG